MTNEGGAVEGEQRGKTGPKPAKVAEKDEAKNAAVIPKLLQPQFDEVEEVELLALEDMGEIWELNDVSPTDSL